MLCSLLALRLCTAIVARRMEQCQSWPTSNHAFAMAAIDPIDFGLLSVTQHSTTNLVRYSNLGAISLERAWEKTRVAHANEGGMNA